MEEDIRSHYASEDLFRETTWDLKSSKVQRLIYGHKEAMGLDLEHEVDPFLEQRRQKLAPKPLQNKPFDVISPC